MEDQLQIYLCARDANLSQAWRMYCGHVPFVTVTKQDIMHVDAEAIVSPANSFGFMTGGIDLHYKNYFGQEVEDALRKRIALEFDHERLDLVALQETLLQKEGQSDENAKRKAFGL